ncbi:recombinase family protein [Saccharopolyspora shandongensis]|uniref:recombinase family protein n=1 Tax=Saccharopolyspora shandongensis TaxID=418495 RepID=UPI0034411D38
MTAPARATRARSIPRAVIYVRQSLYREESVSLELQETSCREYCVRNGYTVVDVIPDPGISGRKWDKRPGIQKVLAMVDAGQVDRVIVWRWARLSRKGVHQHIAIDRVERVGAVVESSTEPFDTKTAGGQFGRDVMLAAATFESNQKGEQWREAHERRRRLGLPATGGQRYGYIRRIEGGNEWYEPNLDTAEILEWMYDAYIEGKGFAAIGRDLNARGVPNIRGSRWTQTSVAAVLDSGFGAGFLARAEYRGEKQISVPIGEREWLTGAQDPIIDEEKWSAYLSARHARTHMAPRTVNPRHPLSGLMRCGDEACGRGPMNRRKIGKHYTFTCVNRLRFGAGEPCNVMEVRVIEHLMAWLAELADDVGIAARTAREVRRAQLRVRSDADAARAELAGIDKELVELTRQLVAGRVPEMAYDAARDQLMAKRSDVERRVALAEQASVEPEQEPQELARDLLRVWDVLPVLRRREMLAQLIAHVEVTPGEPDSAGRGRRHASIRVVPKWESQ